MSENWYKSSHENFVKSFVLIDQIDKLRSKSKAGYWATAPQASTHNGEHKH